MQTQARAQFSAAARPSPSADLLVDDLLEEATDGLDMLSSLLNSTDEIMLTETIERHVGRLHRCVMRAREIMAQH